MRLTSAPSAKKGREGGARAERLAGQARVRRTTEKRGGRFFFLHFTVPCLLSLDSSIFASAALQVYIHIRPAPPWPWLQPPAARDLRPHASDRRFLDSPAGPSSTHASRKLSQARLAFAKFLLPTCLQPCQVALILLLQALRSVFGSVCIARSHCWNPLLALVNLAPLHSGPPFFPW